MNLLVIETIQAFAGQNNYIHRWKVVLIKAKRLANDTPNTVTLHRSSYIFFGDHKPEPGVVESVVIGENEDLLIGDFQRDIIKYTLKTPAS